MKTSKISIIIFVSVGLLAVSGFAYAQLQNETRKEYVYCPIDTELLDKSVTYEINGCPIIRVYVENYDRLDTLKRTQIDNTLRTDGFIPKEEFEIDEDSGRLK